MSDKPSNSSHQVTLLLEQIRGGQPQAMEQLLPLVYAELRKLAAGYMRRERPGHTLQATALVHEAFLKMVDGDEAGFANRSHFFGVASSVMRHILVDHARSHTSGKRGGAAPKLQLDEALVFSSDQSFELLELNDALERLEKLSPRQAKIVEMRYFTGLSIPETAAVLEVAPRTVIREWAVAQAWLRRELGA